VFALGAYWSRRGKGFPQSFSAGVELTEEALPAGAEVWFAIPRWQTIAPSYGAAVEIVLAKIGEMRGATFTNLRLLFFLDKQIVLSSLQFLMAAPRGCHFYTDFIVGTHSGE
jgi:hypothetical protein